MFITNRDDLFAKIDENLPRREREKSIHRMEIMSAATRVFAEKGYFAATLDEVAQEAEFSKGSLYNYFSSKEDLLYNILKQILNIRNRGFSSFFSGKKTFKEELIDFFIDEFNFVLGNPNIIKLMQMQHIMGFNALSDKHRQKLGDIHNKGLRIILERISIAINNKQLKDIPADDIKEAIFITLQGLVFSPLSCRKFADINEHARLHVNILLNGIAREKGE